MPYIVHFEIEIEDEPLGNGTKKNLTNILIN